MAKRKRLLDEPGYVLRDEPMKHALHMCEHLVEDAKKYAPQLTAAERLELLRQLTAVLAQPD